MYTSILVATDGSELSHKAVTSGIDLATLTGAALVIVKVVPRYARTYFEGSIPVSMDDSARIEQQWIDDGQLVVDSYKAGAEAKGVKVQTVVVQSDLVAEGTIAAATKHHADLIVMASHGRKGITRLLLGSETQHVLTHSHTPVLILR
ncbi:MAG: universal stress protein [Ferruginibacter sp.]|nr:universal stress protein [Rhodoferax sp.]